MYTYILYIFGNYYVIKKARTYNSIKLQNIHPVLEVTGLGCNLLANNVFLEPGHVLFVPLLYLPMPVIITIIIVLLLYNSRQRPQILFGPDTIFISAVVATPWGGCV